MPGTPCNQVLAIVRIRQWASNRKALKTPLPDNIQEMVFALVKLSASQEMGHRYVYRSTIMELGASPKCTKTFDSDIEMIAVMNRILAKQKRHANVRLLTETIRVGDHYFFDLNLTRQEAQALGWTGVSEESSHQQGVGSD